MVRPQKQKPDASVDLRLSEIGCVVCRRPAEIHHLRRGVGLSQRSTDAIPLCPDHHRTGGHGVAFHAGPRAFELAHGTEDELLAKTQTLLTQHKERWHLGT